MSRRKRKAATLGDAASPTRETGWHDNAEKLKRTACRFHEQESDGMEHKIMWLKFQILKKLTPTTTMLVKSKIGVLGKNVEKTIDSIISYEKHYAFPLETMTIDCKNIWFFFCIK